MTAKTEPLHERHRCHIERRNGTTSIGNDAKPSPTVWQLQLHVNKTAKDSSPFAMSVSCTFLAKRLQNRGMYVCKDVGYEGCWSIAPKKSKTSVLAEVQHLIVNETVGYNVVLTREREKEKFIIRQPPMAYPRRPRLQQPSPAQTAAPIHCQWVPLRHAAPSWRCLHPCLTDMRAEDWPAEHFEKEHVHDRSTMSNVQHFCATDS